MTDVVITAAKRTPVGAFLGAFANVPAYELGRVAIEAALIQAGVGADEVSEVILGQVLTAAQGQNPARQASMAAGIPKEVPAWGVNQVCGSGLRAVALATQAIQTGDARIVVAGGCSRLLNAGHRENRDLVEQQHGNGETELADDIGRRDDRRKHEHADDHRSAVPQAARLERVQRAWPGRQGQIGRAHV